jgi:hypothetical protein
MGGFMRVKIGGDLTAQEVADIAKEMRQLGHDCDKAEALHDSANQDVDVPWDLDRTRFEREA